MNAIICPTCANGTSLDALRVTRDALLIDRSSNNTLVYGDVVVRLMEPSVFGVPNYGIVVCQVCGERIVVKNAEYASDTDWEPVYPISHKKASDTIPEPIKGEFEEGSLCLAVNAYRACASMCQIAVESLWRDRSVSGLNQLLSDGIISQSLFDRATEIRLWANAAKHKPLQEPVSAEDAEQLLDYLAMILDHVYVQPTKLEALKQKRQRLQK